MISPYIIIYYSAKKSSNILFLNYPHFGQIGILVADVALMAKSAGQ